MLLLCNSQILKLNHKQQQQQQNSPVWALPCSLSYLFVCGFFVGWFFDLPSFFLLTFNIGEKKQKITILFFSGFVSTSLIYFFLLFCFAVKVKEGKYKLFGYFYILKLFVFKVDPPDPYCYK